jgi:WD40 repeat protein
MLISTAGCDGCSAINNKRPAWVDRSPDKMYYYDVGNLKPAVSADDNWVAVNLRESIKVECLSDAGKSFELKTADYATNLAFAGDRYLVSIHIVQGMFTDVAAWDVVEKTKVKQFRLHEVVEGFAVSPDGKFIVVGTNRNQALLLRVPSLEVSGQVGGAFDQTTRLFSAAFSPDGKSVYMGDDKGKLNSYRIDEIGNLFPTGCKELGAFVYSVAVSPDGKRFAVGIAAGGGNGNVLLLKGDSLEEAQRIQCDVRDAMAIAFSPDSNEFVAGRHVHQRDGEQYQRVEVKEKPANEPPAAQLDFDFDTHSNGISRVCYFPSGKRVLMSAVSCTTSPSITGDFPTTRCSGRVAIFKRD